MISRRSIIFSMLSSPVFFLTTKLFVGSSAVTTVAPLKHIEDSFERKLEIKLSNFNKAKWTYAGQQYEENSETLWLNEDEKVRWKITNDLNFPQKIEIKGLLCRLVTDEKLSLDSKSITLTANSFLEVDISAAYPMSKASIALASGEHRSIEVRACDQLHPLVA